SDLYFFGLRAQSIPFGIFSPARWTTWRLRLVRADILFFKLGFRMPNFIVSLLIRVNGCNLPFYNEFTICLYCYIAFYDIVISRYFVNFFLSYYLIITYYI